MKITNKNAKRINKDFGELSLGLKELSFKKDSLERGYQKRLSPLSDLEYILTKVKDMAHTILGSDFWHDLKVKNLQNEFSLKIACEVYAKGLKGDYKIKKAIRDLFSKVKTF